VTTERSHGHGGTIVGTKQIPFPPLSFFSFPSVLFCCSFELGAGGSDVKIYRLNVLEVLLPRCALFSPLPFPLFFFSPLIVLFPSPPLTKLLPRLGKHAFLEKRCWRTAISLAAFQTAGTFSFFLLARPFLSRFTPRSAAGQTQLRPVFQNRAFFFSSPSPLPPLRCVFSRFVCQIRMPPLRFWKNGGTEVCPDAYDDFPGSSFLLSFFLFPFPLFCPSANEIAVSAFSRETHEFPTQIWQK